MTCASSDMHFPLIQPDRSCCMYDPWLSFDIKFTGFKLRLSYNIDCATMDLPTGVRRDGEVNNQSTGRLVSRTVAQHCSDLPSSSTSSIISCSSSGVGFWPSILITFPSSLVLMQPSSASCTKMSKAALNSAGSKQHTGRQLYITDQCSMDLNKVSNTYFATSCIMCRWLYI